MHSRTGLVLAALFAATACGDDDDTATTDVTGFTETESISVCDPATGTFSADVTNPFFPLPVGRVLVLTGEEAGAAVELRITVLGGTETVAGVPTRIMEERQSEDGELVEVSRNFFAQAPDGTVCYFGEDVDIFEGGEIVNHAGQWRAGVDGAVPGIFMPAQPVQGMAFRQEVAPAVAEDRVTITAVGQPVTVPAGTFQDTVSFLEDTPLEPVTSTKVFVRDIGMVVDDTLSLESVTQP